MSINMTEFVNTNDGKWQVLESDLGGSTVIDEFDNRADAVEKMINLKQQNPNRWLSVSHSRTETTWVYLTSV